MALITCSECSKSYSDKADACPSCSCPTNLQPQASSQSQEEATNTPKTLTSLSTKNIVSSANNEKLKIGGIIAIGVGTMIALSSGLITGSEKESYRFGNTWQTDVSRSDGEQLAANGFLVLGIITATGGLLSLLTGFSADEGNERASPIPITTSTLGIPHEKLGLFFELVDKINLEYSETVIGVPSPLKSQFLDDELIVNSTQGITICRFKKLISSDSPTGFTWQIYDREGKPR